MRLVQVAKILGMTGQELRHELTQVNFGVKPTDREVTDMLAKGIIRFFAQKKGLNIDLETLVSTNEGDEEEGGGTAAAEVSAPKQEQRFSPVLDQAQAEQKTAEHLNVLRKLTLEDVPRAAVNHQARELQKARHGTSAHSGAKREAPVVAKKPAVAGVQTQIKRKEGIVSLPNSITVKEFAEKTGIQVPQVIQAMMKNGVLATITQSIDYDTAAIVAAELGVQVQREEKTASAEDLFSRNLDELLKDDPENLTSRPPIVAVMGHVDHGKTSILDAIRQTDVVSGEAGGITQHIGAYQVEHMVDGKMRKMTFLDTPGHEAFTAMRARGAQVTDVVILVVSAEEGVRPTTIEAINHAKDAGVPIVVAINKMDKERADPDRVKGELAQHELQPEDWGGTTPMVPCSAKTKLGISDLLDHVILATDVLELKANPNRSAVATVIESHLDTALGALATVIVNTGSLHVSDVFVCGEVMGRVKTMMDAKGQRLQEVGPSGPVRISGINGVPRVGDIVQVVPNDKQAKALIEKFKEASNQKKTRTGADLVSRLSQGKLQQLKIVLKTDAQGSLEAITQALSKLGEGRQDVSVKVIHGAIGAVSESDVMMASASAGMVMAFHVNVPPEVKRTAEHEGIQVREHTILYELLDEVQLLLSGLVEPIEEESILGHLEVKGVFLTKKGEQIVGGRVTDGVIKRVQFRLVRAGQVLGTGRISSLRHVDKDIKEAKEGSECGMRVEISQPVAEGDVFEAYVREFRKKAIA